MIDITGKKFSRLTVVRYLRNGAHWKPIWECRCECGALTEVLGEHLRSGNTKSCGCLIRDTTTKRSTRHGHSKRGANTGTYRSWQAMIRRCTKPNEPSFDVYGGAGVTVCKRWLRSFDNFLADMGEKPTGTSIDRINNAKGYTKANCRWADKRTQAINRKTTRMITFRGETLCIKDWARKIGIRYATLLQRINHGWKLDRALVGLSW